MYVNLRYSLAPLMVRIRRTRRFRTTKVEDIACRTAFLTSQLTSRFSVIWYAVKFDMKPLSSSFQLCGIP